MNVPTMNPQLNSTINDHSLVDDSIKQDGVKIQAGAGSVLNMNSGNGRSNSGSSKWSIPTIFHVLFVSTICDFLICWFIMWTNEKMEDRADARQAEVSREIKQISINTANVIREVRVESEKATAESKEGTIWILRRDILNSIDFHEAKGEISSKEYKRIKDQFDYYKSLGGNHDVEGRFDEFTAKIYGTAEIKMTK